jgi:hypothetical protein
VLPIWFDYVVSRETNSSGKRRVQIPTHTVYRILLSICPICSNPTELLSLCDSSTRIGSSRIYELLPPGMKTPGSIFTLVSFGFYCGNWIWFLMLRLWAWANVMDRESACVWTALTCWKWEEGMRRCYIRLGFTPQWVLVLVRSHSPLLPSAWIFQKQSLCPISLSWLSATD